MICYQTFKYQLEPQDTFPPEVPFNTSKEELKWKPAEYSVNYNEKEECFEVEVTWVLDLESKWNVL